MNLLEQFCKNMEFLGLGTVADDSTPGDIYWGVMPETPNDCCCVYSRDSGTAASENGARIQVVVRGVSSRAAYEWSQRIAEELHLFDGYLGGDGAHATIEALNASAGLGTDNKRRELYSSNFLVRYCNY